MFSKKFKKATPPTVTIVFQNFLNVPPTILTKDLFGILKFEISNLLKKRLNFNIVASGEIKHATIFEMANHRGKGSEIWDSAGNCNMYVWYL